MDRSEHSSEIKSDWLITGKIDEEICYLFVDSDNKKRNDDRKSRTYYIKSFFPKRKLEYGHNAIKVAILAKQKINLSTGYIETITCHKNFDINKISQIVTEK